MPEEPDRLTELQETVRILTLENDRLAERAEDTLLLGLIAERINRAQEVREILDAGLEQISLLKDVALAAFWDLAEGRAVLRTCYCNCLPEELSAAIWEVPPELRARPAQGFGRITEDQWKDWGLFPRLAEIGVRIHAGLWIRVGFVSGAEGLFLFGDVYPPERLEALQPLFSRGAEWIAARCDNVQLLGQLRDLNAELDRRVERRTGELLQANHELARQILERQAAEQSLALSEEKFRRVFADGPLGMVLADLAGRFLEVNRAFGEFLGYRPEELVGRTIAEITHPEDRSLNDQVLAETLRREQTSYALEKRYLHQDGRIVSGRVITRILSGGDGQPHLRLGMVEDITAKKQAEQALAEQQHLREQLAQARKMESVGRLAGGVAHDFNNLLTAILGNVELARAEPAVGASPALADFLGEIHQASRRAADLTRQLLAFSRKQVLSMQAVDLNQTVAGLGRMLQRLIRENVEMRMALSPDLGLVRADPTQVEQVLLNLVLNARDAMPGGGRLTIETGLRQVDAAAVGEYPEASPGLYATVAVRDTGCGMDAATREHIFEPFFTTKPQGQGTGLGLATVYGIVRQHGGFVTCASEPGRGTTFLVGFPLDPDPCPVSGEGVAPAATPGGTESILLVEDDAAVRQLTGRLLRRLGYAVWEAADGEEALRLVRQHPAMDLLVTDMIMPGMGGRQVYEAVGEVRAGLRAVFVSGYAEEFQARADPAEPGRVYLQKPFSNHELARAVRRALRE